MKRLKKVAPCSLQGAAFFECFIIRVHCCNRLIYLA